MTSWEFCIKLSYDVTLCGRKWYGLVATCVSHDIGAFFSRKAVAFAGDASVEEIVSCSVLDSFAFFVCFSI